MLDIFNSLFGLDIISLLFGLVIGLAPTIGFLIVRGALFEYQEWRKRKQETKGWYDQVERTANGIQRAWHYSGTRPEDNDRQRTAKEMNNLTEELKQYKKHQNATKEMVETINEIIERWDDSEEIILSPHSSQPYLMRGQFLSDDAQDLKDLLNQERQGRIRNFLSRITTKSRDGIERIRRWRYSRQSFTLPYEIYRELSIYLSGDQISTFNGGDDFLCINRRYGTDAVFYNRDENRYNIIEIDLDRDDDPVVVDRLEGKTVTEDMLLRRLKQAETIDTIPFHDIVPDDQSLEEFEYSGTDSTDEQNEELKEC